MKKILFLLILVWSGLTNAISQTSDFANVTAPLLIPDNAEVVASMDNKNIRLSYVKCGLGNQALACQMQVKVKGQWYSFGSSIEDNKIFVISKAGSNSKPNFKFFYPAWIHNDTLTQNPYLSGSISEAIPVKATNMDKRTIAVEYVTKGNHKIVGYWRMPDNSQYLKLSLDFTPSQSGCYSLGVFALHASIPSNITNILLPPLYQYRRFPEKPQMLVSAMMQQPLSIAECEIKGERISAFISGDDSTFSDDWGGVDYSPIGFAIKNHANMVQPVAFAPVLGMSDSSIEAGKTIERSFVIGLTDHPWNETLEYISENIYKVKDYRRQEGTSLTEAMFNIEDLMNDNNYGGWDANTKGFYDIEGKPTKAPTVVQSAPLAVIGSAVISHDEDMYIKRALPTIEYTLSRKGYRWSTNTTDNGYNKDIETLRFNPFKSQFTTSYYEGLNRLLGKKNPWIEELALPNGTIRTVRGYSTPILSWVQALYAYRLTKDPKWLRQAETTAKRDIDLHIYKNLEKPVRYAAFYNTAMYGAWWDLLDLYETTNNKEYLDAARYGAAQTIAGIRIYPAVRDTVMTIHKGNIYNGNTTMWWKGSEKFRLGFPRVKGDAPEKTVPVWKVSPVGLGFEQPSTYFLRAKGKLTRPVFMSNWSPHLLRLYQYTGLKVFETFARNAIIGRYANYPGYYATGYTDITMKEDYPYKGPDVSSIYYHHIPPHLAFTADYLVSEIIQRTNGKISFPYGKQEGFVWFSNRIYGGEPGTVFDDSNVSIWLKRGLIKCSNPSVNYVTAISDKYFWIILSGENFEETITTIKLGKEIYSQLSDNKFTEYDNSGKKQNGEMTGDVIKAVIPVKGCCAFALPIKSALNPFRNIADIPVLKDGMKIFDSQTEAGKVYMFRIRSPFGWDSLYGFCETAPTENLSVSVICKDKTFNITSYPFEWSILKFDSSETITVSIHIRDAQNKEFDKTITFK